MGSQLDTMSSQQGNSSVFSPKVWNLPRHSLLTLVTVLSKSEFCLMVEHLTPIERLGYSPNIPVIDAPLGVSSRLAIM